MIRARLWFRCAAVGDPVSPILVAPAQIGWEAEFRQIDLVIERPFKGEELLRRMKGWITVDPDQVIETIRPFGRLKLLDERNLVVEFENQEALQSTQTALAANFSGRVDLKPLTN